MPVTADWVVATVVGRIRGKLAAVGLSTATTAAANADVAPAVYAAAVQWLGLPLADPTAVADGDLVALGQDRAAHLLDATTLEALYVCLGACDAVDETVELNTQRLSQIQAGISEAIEMYRERLSKPYGASVPAAAVSRPPAGPEIPNDPFNPCRSRPADPRTWPYRY